MCNILLKFNNSGNSPPLNIFLEVHMIDLHFIYTIIWINICWYCQSIIFVDKKACDVLVKLRLGFVALLLFNSLKLCFGLILVFFLKRTSKYVVICWVMCAPLADAPPSSTSWKGHVIASDLMQWWQLHPFQFSAWFQRFRPDFVLIDPIWSRYAC